MCVLNYICNDLKKCICSLRLYVYIHMGFQLHPEIQATGQANIFLDSFVATQTEQVS